MNERLRANLLPAEGSRAETFRSPRAGQPGVVLCCHAPGDQRVLLLESAPSFAAAAQAHGWTLVLSCEPGIDEAALVGSLSARFDHVLAIGADTVITDPEFDPTDDLTAGWGSAVERFAKGDLATRAAAIALRRDRVVAEFPARFERLRSPAAAGVDLGPRRQTAVAVRALDEMSADELRAIVHELGATDDAHRARLRELLDQSEVAVYEQVRVERRTGELVDQIQRLEAELAAMRDSKLFRAVAPLRKLYAKLRGHRG